MVEINLRHVEIKKRVKDNKWAIEFEESIYPLSSWGRGVLIVPIDKDYAWLRVYQFCSQNSGDFPPQCEGAPKLQFMYMKKIFMEDVEPNKILVKGTIHL